MRRTQTLRFWFSRLTLGGLSIEIGVYGKNLQIRYLLVFDVCSEDALVRVFWRPKRHRLRRLVLASRGQAWHRPGSR